MPSTEQGRENLLQTSTAIPGVRPPTPRMHDTGMATSIFTLAEINPMPTPKPARTSTPSVFAGRAWQQVLARDAAAAAHEGDG